ncbi:TlpA disulfide reductase family protein [Candidatus Accumulibacter sp. ACC003]|uniref:TlpA family protein disulfide reductase n=1 Tax=Candidatus Accumulibacter sp. ACC003 TaxID=2823334 RepID=UPI0025C1D303|nr:TlpA disulfide reductase family protein [Candidatus Accumulibacter sp. ACC003]
MSRRQGLLLGLFAAIFAILAGFYALSQRFDTRQQDLSADDAAVVERFFATSLDDVHGQAQAFSQWQGKTLVVNFWATWCPPCRDEMPAFSRLQRLHGAKGVQFVGIALDSAESVLDFSQLQRVTYPLLIGGARGIELAQQFGNVTLALPYTVVISPAKKVDLVRLGPLSEVELDRFLHQATSR